MAGTLGIVPVCQKGIASPDLPTRFGLCSVYAQRSRDGQVARTVTDSRGLSLGGWIMLVLSRKPGERIVVPNCDLTFTIVAVEGNNVRLGISAPTNVGIYREEVWRRICREHTVPERIGS
jgi:carbon storage regulator